MEIYVLILENRDTIFIHIRNPNFLFDLYLIKACELIYWWSNCFRKFSETAQSQSENIFLVINSWWSFNSGDNLIKSP